MLSLPNCLKLLFIYHLSNNKNIVNAETPRYNVMSISYSHILNSQQRMRNLYYRILIFADYKSIKHNVVLIHNCAKEKINNTYQEIMTNYYNNVLHYYSMEEDDLFVIDNLVQLLF